MNKQVNKAVTEAVVDGVNKTRDAGEKWSMLMKDAGKNCEDLTAKAGANARTLANKLIENTEKNTEAAFKTVVAAAEAGTFAKAAEVQSSFAQAQFQAMNAQTAELFELSMAMFSEYGNAVKAVADASIEQVKASA